ncbi:MAG TPA: efflux RND transporter periplasmic adaptor subunit [Steroidobacteraceae bacterium]
MRISPCASQAAAGLIALLCALAAGCGRDAATAGPPAVEVKVVEVKPQSTEIYRDLVGEVRGSQEVEIRARVTGILTGKHFEDGSIVPKDSLLYTIDAREYRAQVATAEAQLASAEANLARARQDVERYEPLLAENAISQQVYDNAVAAAKQAAAQVTASRAAITEAKLGVEYAQIRAPMTGRIGASQVFEGALITAGQTQLATISDDDPAWVYFSLSEAELLDYQRLYGPQEPAPDAPQRQVRLSLSDGSVYPQPGFINFADRALDSTTGTYTLRAEFPNPGHALVPGLFARIRLTTEVRPHAIVLPDRAVQQQLGRYFVTAVGADDKAEARPVKLGPRLGTRWVIVEGVAAGDRIVVEGTMKARPGTPLKPTVVTDAELQGTAGPASPAA